MKQAMSVAPCRDWEERLNTVHSYKLCYGQAPLLSTIIDRHPTFRQAPNSTNVIVAFIAAGSNVEDSVIINKSSVERGLFQSRKRRVKTVTSRHRVGTSQIIEAFEKPRTDLPGRVAGADYSALESDGVPAIGTRLKEKDIIVGATLTTMQFDSCSGQHVPKKTDTSFALRRDEAPTSYSTYLKHVIKADNQDRQIVRIALEQLRPMKEGDKV